MIKAVLWRFAFLVFAFLVIFRIGYFISERNEVNREKFQPEKLSVKTNIKTSTSKFVSEDIIFSPDFFFGTASSDFQTAGLSPASDWAHEWEKMTEILKNDSIAKKGLTKEAIRPGVANDFFNRYKEDFDLASQGQITQVHRISLEWARIEPEEGKWDFNAVNKYREIFSYMKSRGIEPMICLNHFPNPKWFTDKGGWENFSSEYDYEKYAKFVAENIGVPLKIKWWLTYNEPQFTIIVPYGNGTWPPFKGIKSFQDKEGFARIMLVASNVLDGHRLAYRAIHGAIDGKLPKGNKLMVGFASAPSAFDPYDENSPMDKLADNFFNVIYTLSLDSFIGNVDRDFIGLNYYGRNKLKLHMSLSDYVLSWLTEERPFAIEWFGPEKLAHGDRPKEFHPRSLYQLIMKFKNYGLPIVITENGLNDASDKYREEFMIVHLKAIYDAMLDGAPVIGYQYWSLTDTWEPGEAFFSSFGLIEIDRKNNLERKLRPSALTYGEIIKTHTIKKELLEKHKKLLINQN